MHEYIHHFNIAPYKGGANFNYCEFPPGDQFYLNLQE